MLYEVIMKVFKYADTMQFSVRRSD